MLLSTLESAFPFSGKGQAVRHVSRSDECKDLFQAPKASTRSNKERDRKYVHTLWISSGEEHAEYLRPQLVVPLSRLEEIEMLAHNMWNAYTQCEGLALRSKAWLTMTSTLCLPLELLSI